MRHAPLAAFLLAASAAAAQQPTPPGPRNRNPYPAATGPLEPAATALVFYAENDVLLGSRGTDRNYTGSFAVASHGRWVDESGLTGPLRRVDRLFGLAAPHRRGVERRHSFTVVGTAFTPQVLDEARPIRDDRPYASVVGVTVRRLAVDARYDAGERGVSVLSTDLTVGALGLDLAKAVQTDLHRELRRRSGRRTPSDPLGWGNQVSDGGEPTLLYRVMYERFLAGDAPSPSAVKHAQLTWNAQGNLGYYTNVAAGLSGRAGRFLANFWDFNSNPLTGVQQRASAAGGRRPWEAYAFAGVRGRAVAYNALLQGQFRESAHAFSASQIRRAVGEGEAGAATSLPVFGGSLGVNWTVVAGRTPEFRGPKSRAHAWGAVHVSYASRLPGQTR